MWWRLGILAYICYGAYYLTRGSTAARDRILLNALAFIIVISALQALRMGIVSGDEDSDPIFSSGSSYQEFEPTLEQRSTKAVTTSLYLFPAVGVGVWLGLKRRNRELQGLQQHQTHSEGE